MLVPHSELRRMVMLEETWREDMQRLQAGTWSGIGVCMWEGVRPPPHCFQRVHCVGNRG